MRIWGHVIHGMRALLRREETDREIADEARHFFEEAEADLMVRGATPHEARRAVRLRYGDEVAAREDVASGLWESHVDIFLKDAKLAARRLWRSPGFVTLVAVILGLGVGSATAIYSVVRPTLIDPLGYPRADRIVSVAYRSDTGELPRVAFGSVLEVRARSDDFEFLSAFKSWQPTLAGESEPVRLEAQRVGAEYFDVLGTPPRFGPGFDEADDRPGGPSVVVLSDELWRFLGAETDIIGTTVRLDGEPYTVVGVMGEDFVNATTPAARAWSPLQYDASVASFDTREWGRHLDLVGRLRAGVRIERAQANLDALAGTPRAAFPRPEWTSLEEGLVVRPLRDVATARARPTALLLTGAAAFLLLIACVNLTILFIGRSARRQGELAMRAALGAGRQRIGKQLVTESVLVAGVGGMAGLLVARLGMDALVRLSPPTLQHLEQIRLDAGSFVLAMALTTIIGVGVGLAPLLTCSRRPLHEAVRGTPPGITRRHAALRRSLVAGEVSAALVLLVGAGLLIRTTDRLFSVPLGFDPEGRVVMKVYGTGLDPEDAAIHGFFDLALQGVREAGGVRGAALTNQMPLSGDAELFGVRPADPAAPPESGGSAFRYAVTPDYFEVMGISPVGGRLLQDGDDEGAPRVAVVSRSLAGRLFGGADPLGRRITVGAQDSPPFTIVGVVGDVKHAGLDSPETQAVYATSHQWHFADPVRWVILKSDRGLAESIGVAREAIWAADPDRPIVNTESLDELVERSESVRAFVRVVLGFFAALAVTLATLGLYGVLASVVADRRRELGVRAALGASQDRLLRLVFGQGMRLTVLGIGFGVAIAMIARRLVTPFLFGVSSLDPVTYLAVVGLLLSTTGIACWLPAVRATRVDPLAVLKPE